MKRVLRAGLGVLLLAAAAAGAAIAFAPFQTHMTLRRLALRLGGVRRVSAGPLRAYERDACRPGAACRCVALVHGMGDSAMTWDKTLLGHGGAAVPPEGTLLLAVDLPGTDGSPAVADYGLRAQARVLRESLETRCPQWTVAGNSLGGWISTWLAVDWPEGVSRLVLINAAGLSDPSGLTLAAAKTLSAPTVPELKLFNARAYGSPRPIPERAWKPAVDAILSRPTREIYEAFRETDVVEPRLKDVRAEATIIWGSADGVLPSEFAERFAKGLRGSRVVRVAGCGHLPQQECPESVSRVLFEEKR